MSTNMTPEEESTIKSYDDNASGWSQGHMLDFYTKEREEFKKLLPSGKILEIGSGSGRDAQLLIKAGYDYTGTDASIGLLEVARSNNPTGQFLHQSVYQLDFPESSFDGFWTAATLLHIPKNKINFALNNIFRAIKPEGIGFISIKQGIGEQIIEEDRGQEGIFKRLFIFYSQEEFNQILEANNFKIHYSHIHPPDGKTIWLTFVVQVAK